MASITFKAIVPKSKFLLDPRFYRNELSNALDHTANIIRDDFKKTTKTWSNKPSFQKKGPRRKITRMEVEVFTENLIYFFLTRGTRKNYPIPKGGPGFLRFRTGYKAKSRPRIISSRAGGASGPFVIARRVTHPGIEARDFDKEIARRRQKNLNNLVRLALLRAIQHSAS